MAEGSLEWDKDPDEIAKLKMKPIAMPTLGHMLMLPLDTEVVLIDLEARVKGDTAIHGISMDEKMIQQVKDDIAERGADTWIGFECLIYVLPDGYEGPLA